MSLYAFLNAENCRTEKEIILSDRFKDENGNIQAFKIRSLTQEENDEITRKSYKIVKSRNGNQETFDAIEYNRRLVVAATVYPNFSDKEICDHFGTLDPLMVPGKMLKPGEYAMLLAEISDLSGFNDESTVENLKN